VEAELNGIPFERKLVTRTAEGVALQPLYTRADGAGLPDLASRPGAVPFLRGVRPQGYKQRAWQVAQEIAVASPQAFNTALLADLMHGQDSVVLAPARPGPAGGVVLENLADLGVALAGVDLSAVPVHLRAGADALPWAALFLALADQRGIARTALAGSLTADPLAEWAETGNGADLDGLYDSLAGWTAWAAQHTPELQTIGVNGAIWADAGGSAVHELAFALAAATDYIRALQARGVPPEVAGARLCFQFSSGPQFFMELAKFRAWRPLWTRVLAAFGAAPALAARAPVQVATARWNKTRLDPHVNLLRVTTEALAAVLGGCDSLHIAPFDEVTGATDDFSRRVARNLHTILAEEFGFTQTADPAGGSWYVEKLTDELARKAWALFQTIESAGGLAAALRAGIPQRLIATAAAEKADAVGRRRLGLVGTNLFPNLKEKSAMVPSCVPPGLAGRSEEAPARAVEPDFSRTWPARLEAAIGAARAGAGVRELIDRGRAPGAAAPDIATVVAWRAAAGFERLRAASADYTLRSGHRPRVFLARMGPVKQHKARADFAAGFFAVGGFEVLAGPGFSATDAAAQAAVAAGAPVVVLCSTDETYPGLVPAFGTAVKSARPGGVVLVLAGLPAEPALEAAYRASGVDEFIHLRANVLDLLEKMLRQLGALT
jgi:methylmalonyl-CoA mutase